MPTTPSTTHDVQRQFGAVARNYVTSAVHAAGKDLVALVEAAGLRGGERVLDMGSGAGHTALALAAKGAEVVGLDVTAEMVAVATELAAQRGLANVTFREGDVGALPFAPGEFDIVTSRFSAHHYANPQAALSEAARVLKPGGKFLLVDCVAPEDPALDTFLNTFEFLRDTSHVRDWRASEWVRMLQAEGFAAEVLLRSEVVLDGQSWVDRMQTPETHVAMLRTLFAQANSAQRRAFDLREQPWGLTLPVVLIAGLR
ncbi:MAG: methyltransferase domain-containing protein [Chloroflexi bacterium]|nr:methyltransferase domain-containing protein [Chloroflexota bacterium]